LNIKRNKFTDMLFIEVLIALFCDKRLFFINIAALKYLSRRKHCFLLL